MKKLIPGILAMLLCLGLTTGCNNIKDVSNDSSSAPASTDSVADSTPDSIDSSVEDSSIEDSSVEDSSVPETPHAHETDLTDVKDYLNGLMGNKELTTRNNFTVINTYSFFGETAKYDIAWSVDVEGVSVEEGDAEDTIVISELDEDTPYVLTATITDPDGCHSTTVTFNGTALKALSLVPTAITAKPVENTAYKLYVYQSTNATDCYFTGKMSGHYFETSDLYTAGVDLYVEHIENSDNFNVYFNDADGVKQYIGVKLSDDAAHDNIVFATEPVSSFFWNEELGTICTHLDVNKNGEASDYYLGNYSTYMTFSASMISYASGDGNNVGGLVEMVDKNLFTPEVKVNTEKEKLSIETTTFYGDATLELPTVGKTYADVTISWATTSENVSITDNVLTVTAPAADTTAVITATITCGDASVTADVELTLKAAVTLPEADSELTIAEVLDLSYEGDTANKYYVTGVVTEIYNTTYGNMYIQDENGNQLTVYGTYSADGSTKFNAMDAADQPKVGDTVKFYSILSQYNGVNQLKNAWIIEVTAGEGGEVTPPADELPAADSELTIAEVLALTYSGDTANKYYVTGVVTEIYNTTYGNMYIQDENGNQLTVYGTYSADGSTQFNAMDAADQPKVGDTVKFYSILSQYNGVNQLKNAWIIEVTTHDCAWIEATCQAPETCSVCGEAKPGSTTVDCVYENGVCKWCSAPEGVATITASKSIADLISSEGWTKSTTKQEFNLDDVVSVKVDGGNNSGKAYNGDHIRIYATDSPAGSLTISLAEGYELVSVKVTTLTGTYAFLCVDGETDISNVTTAVSGSSVVLTSVMNGTDGKQVRVTAIEVVYKAVA